MPNDECPSIRGQPAADSYDLFICLSLKLSARKVSRLLLLRSRSNVRLIDTSTPRRPNNARTYKGELRARLVASLSMEIERRERVTSYRTSARDLSFGNYSRLFALANSYFIVYVLLVDVRESRVWKCMCHWNVNEITFNSIADLSHSKYQFLAHLYSYADSIEKKKFK